MSLYFIGDSFVFEFFEGSFKTLENCVETFFLFFFLFIYLFIISVLLKIRFWNFSFNDSFFFFWDLKFTKILVCFVTYPLRIYIIFKIRIQLALLQEYFPFCKFLNFVGKYIFFPARGEEKLTTDMVCIHFKFAHSF